LNYRSFLSAFIIIVLVLWALPCKAQSINGPLRSDIGVQPNGRHTTLFNLQQYFSESRFSAMNAACYDGDRRGDKDGELCLKAIDILIEVESDVDSRRRLIFLAAMQAGDLGRAALAEKYWRAIRDDYGVMADTVNYWLGEALIDQLHYEEALEAFKRIPTDSRLYEQGLFRQGHCLTRLLRKDEAISLLSKLIIDSPEHFRTPEAIYSLAELYAADNVGLAIPLWKRLASEWPGSGYDRIANTRLSKFSARVWSDSDRIKSAIERAHILIERGYPRKAQDELDEAEDLLGDTRSELKAEFEYACATSLFAMRNYKECITRLKNINGLKVSNESAARALLLQMQAWLRLEDTDKAMETARLFFPRYAKTSSACEMRYLWATSYKLTKNPDDKWKSVEHYLKIVEDYPTCERAESAGHFAAWMLYRQGDMEKARLHFEKLACMPDSRFERMAGQYWLGRMSEREGRIEDAVERYYLVVKLFPLSYYSFLATDRLVRMGRPLPSPVWPKMDLSQLPVNLDLKMDLDFLYRQPAFIKAMELWRLGKRSEASREIAFLQEKVGNNQVDWLFSWIYYVVGDYFRSHWIGRIKCENDLWEYPTPGNRSFWMLSYPMPYKELVLKYSAEYGLDPFFVWAIMREESSFRPEVYSPAKAVGLTQMIYSTGKIVARKLGVPNFKLSDLEDPETSIRFGTFHMRQMIDKFGGNLSLVISSYNAGGSAVARWIAERPDMEMDAFNEDIPFYETRRYTRRVLQSYAIYRYLYTPDKVSFDMWETANAALKQSQ